MRKTICIILAAVALIVVNAPYSPAAHGGSGGQSGISRHGGSGGQGGFSRHGGSGGYRDFDRGRHGGGGRYGGGVWFGPGWWDPGWSYSYYPPYYPSYVAPQIVVPQQPVIYERLTPPEEPDYWYFCRNPEGYYPYVKKCPNGWMKVLPSTPPYQEE